MRQAAGVLPLGEIVQAIADQAFAPLNDRPIYQRDGARQLQEHLRQFPSYSEATVDGEDLSVFSSNAQTATVDQWNAVQELRAALPDADVKLRAHRLSLKHNSEAPSCTLFGVRVTRRVGPFTLQREYATPSGVAAAEPPAAAG